MDDINLQEYELIECLWEAKMYSEAEQTYMDMIERIDPVSYTHLRAHET